jgi:hypothetical protein
MVYFIRKLLKSQGIRQVNYLLVQEIWARTKKIKFTEF